MRLLKHQNIHLSAFGFLTTFLVASPAVAQADAGGGQLTDLMQLLLDSAHSWDGKLRNYALTMFWGLAAIQLVWTFVPLVMKQADFGEIVGELAKYVIVTGFFLFLLDNSVSLASAVIDSFRQAGGEASGFGRALEPSDIFYTALQLALLISDVHTINPFSSIAAALTSLVVLLGFAFIAAFMAMTIVESYIVVNASVIFMGFGASQWTREYTLTVVRYAVAVGAKLFVLTLIVGVINQSATAWAAAYNQDNASMWTMVGLSLVCAYLCKTIPDLIQSVINGTSMGGGHHMGELAASVAAATATTAAIGAIGSTGATAGSNSAALAGTDASVAGGINAGNAAQLDGSGASSASTGYPDYPDAPTKPKDNSPKTFDEALVRRAGPNGQSGEKKSNSTANDSSGSGSSKRFLPTVGEAASGAVKFAGLMSSISVPGMAGAAGLSLGPSGPSAAEPITSDDTNEVGSMEAAPIEAENIIRAASTEVGDGASPQNSVQAASGPVSDHAASVTPSEAFPETAIGHREASNAASRNKAADDE